MDIDQLKEKLSVCPLFSSEKIVALDLLSQQGHCNHNYLLRTETNQYVVRIFGKEPRDRKLEYHIQSLAHAHGIAPKTHHLDLTEGWMLTSFAKGTHLDTLNHMEIKNLARALHALHTLSCKAPNTILKIDTTSIMVFDYDPVLCHHDLNSQNILWDTHIPILIDWEYAGCNDRYFDLASIIVEFNLNIIDTGVFMEAYFQDSTYDSKKLQAYILLYRKVCQHWWAYK